jgi:hypothetical protein
MRKIVAMKFVSATDRSYLYFLGSSEENILADTQNGEDFGGEKLNGYSEIPIEDLKEFEFFEKGKNAIFQKKTECYFVGKKLLEKGRTMGVRYSC